MRKLAEWLGMTPTTTLPGFRPNARSGAMPTCQLCGALVTYETQELHRRWHAEGEQAARP